MFWIQNFNIMASSNITCSYNAFTRFLQCQYCFIIIMQFKNNTFIFGNELRHDLNEHWDVGGHYHILTTPELGLTEYSYGLSAGVDVARNMWLSLGYNFDGFDDEDFDANGYTAKGPFLKLRFKFDQHTFNLRD